jgi:photosystem I P700 chlorophyll a apoprotein A2
MDGPGRGGTCDISALGCILPSNVLDKQLVGQHSNWHWKHMAIWGGNRSILTNHQNYIMGWLRDYLWLNSSPLINGYNAWYEQFICMDVLIWTFSLK